jgi:hypothetical protein
MRASGVEEKQGGNDGEGGGAKRHRPRLGGNKGEGLCSSGSFSEIARAGRQISRCRLVLLQPQSGLGRTHGPSRSFVTALKPDLGLVEVGSQLLGGGNGYGHVDCWIRTGQRTGVFDSIPADDLPASKNFEDRAFSSSIHKHAPHRFLLTLGESTEDHVFWSQVASCQSCSQVGQASVGPEQLIEFLDLES